MVSCAAMTPTDRPEDMIDAGLRHLGTATRCLEHADWEQVAHLAGFGPECLRKAAMLAPPAVNREFGHKLGMHEMLDALSALRPHGLRLRADRLQTTWPALEDWDPQARYAADGTVSADQAKELHTDAAAAVRGLLFAMVLDERDDVLRRIQREAA